MQHRGKRCLHLAEHPRNLMNTILHRRQSHGAITIHPEEAASLHVLLSQAIDPNSDTLLFFPWSKVRACDKSHQIRVRPAGPSEELSYSSNQRTTYIAAARTAEPVPPSSTPLWLHHDPPWTSKRRHDRATRATPSPDYAHDPEEKRVARNHPKMVAAALRTRCQQGQHPKEPRAAEKERDTNIQTMTEHNSEEFIKHIRPLRGTRMVFFKIFTTKVDYKLPYVYYA